MSGEVKKLAEALLGASPAEPRLLEAAWEAADAILHFHRVETSRRLAEEASALLRLGAISYSPTRKLTLWKLQREGGQPSCRALVSELRLQAAEAGYESGLEITATEGVLSLLLSLSGEPDEVRRLKEYERRAFSLRRKALRRLDYERIEAERRI